MPEGPGTLQTEMAVQDEARSASTIAADYLAENAEALVGNWIDWLRDDVSTYAIQSLPERALRNHIPPVLLSLADFVREPADLVRDELIGHLRLHGAIRRDQGYALREVLAEFDGLAAIVTKSVTDYVLTDQGPREPQEVVVMTSRLAEGLRSISFVAMGTFDDSNADRVQTMSAGLEELARAVIHELRDPLNVINLGLDLLDTSIEDDSMLGHTSNMRAAVRRASNLLDTVQVLAISEKARSNEQVIALGDAVRRVVEELSEKANIAGVEIQAEDESPKMLVEAIVIYLALINLVGNAIRYADEDKDDRWIRIKSRFIEEEDDSGYCEVTVADNGIGIPEDLLSRVTQKGFRAHPEQGFGTGLGLYLVAKALGERGGSLHVDSTEGVGTTVRIRMRGLHADGYPLRGNRLRLETLIGKSKARTAATETGGSPDAEEE